MFQIKAKLVYNKKVKGNYLHCVLKAPKISPGASPGQFVNIKLNNTFEPLLRRPFSIHRVSSSNIEILYEVVGRGTEILSEKKPQEALDIIGPLGNGFDWQSPVASRQSPVLVAGGMGVAPLFFLAEKLVQSSCLSLPVRQAGGRQAKFKEDL
jgi:dihydroorotate dehydrogenase electron transfer subunit